MDKVNYLSNEQTTKTEKYPVTIQGLEFIQKQLLQLQQLASVGGGCYIIKPSSAETAGVCVVNGEVLPLAGVKAPDATHLHITSACETIQTTEGDYENVREMRVAVYGKHSSGATFQDAAWVPLSRFADFAPNTELLARINAITASLQERGFLPVEYGVYTLKQLNDKKSPARLFCKRGSQAVVGYSAYAVDVYSCGDGVVYQELRTQDMRLFGRYFNAVTGVWGAFQSVDTEMRLEAKVIRGVLYLRHGFLPPYARIIVLRKKRRGKKAGRGRKNRTVKCAWCHGWKMHLSQGAPNKWYVPKCSQYLDPSALSYDKLSVATELPNQFLLNPSRVDGRKYPAIGKSFEVAIDSCSFVKDVGSGASPASKNIGSRPPTPVLTPVWLWLLSRARPTTCPLPECCG